MEVKATCNGVVEIKEGGTAQELKGDLMGTAVTRCPLDLVVLIPCCCKVRPRPR